MWVKEAPGLSAREKLQTCYVVNLWGGARQMLYIKKRSTPEF